MTTAHLANDISQDEGFRAQAYPDPLTGGEPWTCGYGCTGSDIGPDTVWTRAQAIGRRDAAIAASIAQLNRNASWWTALSDARQDVLVNMTYNMGWPRLATFKRFLAALKANDYPTAVVEMIDSRWARQVPGRAVRLAVQMLHGERQEP